MSDSPQSASTARNEAHSMLHLVKSGQMSAAAVRALIDFPARYLDAPSPFIRDAAKFRQRVAAEFEKLATSGDPPYPWCHDRENCIKLGYCPKNPNCGD